MKILFVENRYCTHIWREVGIRLSQQGHHVAHMVQNPMFTPKDAQSFVLPFPSRIGAKNKLSEREFALPEKLRSDRAVRYWNGTAEHYPHYMQQISKVLDQFQPDVIFGEPTQFHEILTIEAARTRGITYLFPSSTRYPSGRLVFFISDTMDSIGGQGDLLPADVAKSLREQIISRRVMPSYMIATKESALKNWKNRLADKSRISLGWLRGERYITPSPMAKLRLERVQANLRRQWESLAVPTLSATLANSPWILYPMQMQPESNLDVWGYPWNDQAELVSRAAIALGKIGASLVIKPNPKSKYELTSNLLEVVKCHKNIHILSHKSQMAEVFPVAKAVLSVTGTVILECIIAGKPVGVLGEHAMARLPGINRIASPEGIVDVLMAAISGNANTATEADAISLLQAFHSESYTGEMFDPMNQSAKASTKNLDTIALGFLHVLKTLSMRTANVLHT